MWSREKEREREGGGGSEVEKEGREWETLVSEGNKHNLVGREKVKNMFLERKEHVANHQQTCHFPYVYTKCVY